MRSLLLLWPLVAVLVVPARAQAVVDTSFTWQGYSRMSRCHLQIFAVPTDADRPHTVVIREIAANTGPSTLDDTSFLVEQVARVFGIDPVRTTFVIHWGVFSYLGDRTGKQKEVFLRATFRRTRTQRLSSPSWRVITRAEVEAYTDRQFQ